MKKSRKVRPAVGVKSPPTRRLPLVDLLVDTAAELFGLAARSGLHVLDAVLEDDRTTIDVPRYAHQTDRTASQGWPVPSEVVLGGRKVAVRPPGSLRTARKYHCRPSKRWQWPHLYPTIPRLLRAITQRAALRRSEPRNHPVLAFRVL